MESQEQNQLRMESLSDPSNNKREKIKAVLQEELKEMLEQFYSDESGLENLIDRILLQL